MGPVSAHQPQSASRTNQIRVRSASQPRPPRASHQPNLQHRLPHRVNWRVLSSHLIQFPSLN
ncbi:hypothetical protein E2C01_038714 [Portunus trituberculatus]|uniref:Uncharacterized protein n=1 Tax=Portunus trituberculatus TaxID=210409 RepID=A0A5B7FCX7_PORTR|nr:hypothetical protein [Portunus trituberculatus]